VSHVQLLDEKGDVTNEEVLLRPKWKHVGNFFYVWIGVYLDLPLMTY